MASRSQRRPAYNNINNTRQRPAPQEERSFALIASVSRSSGLEKDGDALKDKKVQEEYRESIQKKLDQATTTDRKENVLIMFRKLREGLVSSDRADTFALEVFETSLCLSIVYKNTRQSGAIIPNLVPSMYNAQPSPTTRVPMLVIALLHQLFVAFPSQLPYSELSAKIPPQFFSPLPESHTWIISVAKALRTQNYARLDHLTRQFVIPVVDQPLARDALLELVNNLRAQMRQQSWTILRSSYRELFCQMEYDETRTWLRRSLLIDADGELDPWLDEQANNGHLKPKEGIPGRWIVCKPVK